MGHNLRALTFPEFLSKRFESKFIQYFSGAGYIFGMTLYASVVLIGMARFVETTLKLDYSIALVALGVIVALYVIFGGIRGVMYTDALQGTIMFVGMVILLVATYWILGGVIDANQALTNLVNHGASQCHGYGHSHRIHGMDIYACVGKSLLVDTGQYTDPGSGNWSSIPAPTGSTVHDCEIKQGT